MGFYVNVADALVEVVPVQSGPELLDVVGLDTVHREEPFDQHVFDGLDRGLEGRLSH